jgi:hypothetical protein
MTSSDPARESVTVRLGAQGLQRVRELAAEETEGNLSQMLRRLLTEAILVRDRKVGR